MEKHAHLNFLNLLIGVLGGMAIVQWFYAYALVIALVIVAMIVLMLIYHFNVMARFVRSQRRQVNRKKPAKATTTARRVKNIPASRVAK